MGEIECSVRFGRSGNKGNLCQVEPMEAAKLWDFHCSARWRNYSFEYLDRHAWGIITHFSGPHQGPEARHHPKGLLGGLGYGWLT